MVEINKIANQESAVKVCAIQFEPRMCDKEENVRKGIEMLEEAADKGANLCVLPELFNTGYMFNTRAEVYEVAEQIPDGATTKALEKVAKERNIYIAAGLVELAPDNVQCFNSAVLIGPNGYIGKHRKMHLWCNDKLFFEPGDMDYQVFHTPIGRIGLIICFDMWYFESFRILALKGADIVCCPTNWVKLPPDEIGTMGTYLAMCNAHCNHIFVVAADRIGVERGCTFPGRSCIVGPDGWFLAGPASDDKEEILISAVNLMESRNINLNDYNTIFRDRRTDLYDAALGSGKKMLPR